MRLLLITLSVISHTCLAHAQVARTPVVRDSDTSDSVAVNAAAERILNGQFGWHVEQPILSVDPKQLPATEHPWIAVKDPSIVRYDGKWHLFCTLRKKKSGKGRIRIGYIAFADWSQAKDATWSVLQLTDDYHGAPQIFFFEPQQTWYLVYQATDPSRDLKYGPCYSTNDDISDPNGWTLPAPFYVPKPGSKAGLDYWVICDNTKAHLFFTLTQWSNVASGNLAR